MRELMNGYQYKFITNWTSMLKNSKSYSGFTGWGLETSSACQLSYDLPFCGSCSDGTGFGVAFAPNCVAIICCIVGQQIAMPIRSMFYVNIFDV